MRLDKRRCMHFKTGGDISAARTSRRSAARPKTAGFWASCAGLHRPCALSSLIKKRGPRIAALRCFREHEVRVGRPFKGLASCHQGMSAPAEGTAAPAGRARAVSANSRQCGARAGGNRAPAEGTMNNLSSILDDHGLDVEVDLPLEVPSLTSFIARVLFEKRRNAT